MKYGFLFLLSSIILNTPSFASELETVPLLGPTQSMVIDDEEKIYPLEAVVVDVPSRCPRGIMLPDGQARTVCGLGRDIWLHILSDVDDQDLISMRRVSVFFHRLLTQPSPTLHPLGEEMVLQLIDAKFNKDMPQDILPLQQFTQAISTIAQRLSHSALLVRYKDKLEPHGKQLWRLRYVPGMNVGDLRQMLTHLDMPVDDSWSNWFEARQLGSLHNSRLKGGLAETAKVTLVLGSTALSLWIIYSKTYQLPASCQSIYAFPSQLLEGQITKIESPEVIARVIGSFAVAMTSIFYFITYLKCDLAKLAYSKASWKCSLWGEILSYGEWVGIINNRDSPKYVRVKRILAGIVMPSMATLFIFGGLPYLLFDMKTIFTGQLTIARYIHEELQYSLSQNSSCCAIAINSFLGGSCPRIDANKIQNFSQIISTAQVVQGHASVDILSFTSIAFHVLLVLVVSLLNVL